MTRARFLHGATLVGASLLSSLLFGCVRSVPVEPGSAADTKAKTAAPSEGSGVLLASFDPERVAPEAAPGAGGHDHHEHGAGPDAATTYTCPHHPDVVSDKPGKCPKCGMDLVPKKPAPNPEEGGTHDHGAH